MKFSCSHDYGTEFSGILRIGKTPNTSTVTRIFTGFVRGCEGTFALTSQSEYLGGT